MTATRSIPSPRTDTDPIDAARELAAYLQGLVFAGAIDTLFSQPSARVWPDDNPAYTADELEKHSGPTEPTPDDVIDAINALAAHLAGARCQ